MEVACTINLSLNVQMTVVVDHEGIIERVRIEQPIGEMLQNLNPDRITNIGFPEFNTNSQQNFPNAFERLNHYIRCSREWIQDNIELEEKNEPIFENFEYKREENVPEDRCSICMEVFNDGEFLTKLRCRHFFHDICILRSIHSGYNKCPLCRDPILVAQPSEDIMDMINHSFSAQRSAFFGFFR